MTAARQTTSETEDSFVTIELTAPVTAIQRTLRLESEAMPAVFAVRDAAPALRATGLRHLSISVGRGGGLVLECTLPAELEYEHETTHHFSLFLRRAANAAGSWVESVEFVPTHAE